MDVQELVRLYETANFQKVVDAVIDQSQSLMHASFEANGQSKRYFFKKPPQIVEGDPVDCRLTLENLRDTDFPGGEVLVVAMYGNNQHQGPNRQRISGLHTREKVTLELGYHYALSAGIAEVFLYGRTKNGQVIVFSSQPQQSENIVIVPVGRSIDYFRVWPLSSIYSAIAILVAGVSLAVALLATAVSLLTR